MHIQLHVAAADAEQPEHVTVQLALVQQQQQQLLQQADSDLLRATDSSADGDVGRRCLSTLLP